MVWHRSDATLWQNKFLWGEHERGQPDSAGLFSSFSETDGADRSGDLVAVGVFALFGDCGGTLCDCKLFVRRDNGDDHRGIRRGDDARFLGTGVVLLHIELDAERGELLADHAAHDLVVFADASGERDDIETTELGGVGANIAHDAVHVDVERELGVLVAFGDEAMDFAHVAEAGHAHHAGLLVEEVIELIKSHSRLGLITKATGITSTAQLKELTTDMLRPRGDLWENGIFQDSVSVQDGTDLYLFQAIHQEADVVVETVDCIRAMIGEVKTAAESIAITNKAVGLTAIR